MNTQEYISSGVIESCVLGLASHEEQLELERLCAEFPEIRAAKESFEMSLEQHAMANAVAPPLAVKQKIWAEIKPGAADVVKMPAKETQVPVRRMNIGSYVAAASVILLVASTVLNFYFYNQYQHSVAKLDELAATINETASSNRAMQTKLQQYQTAMDMIKNPNMAVIPLKGEPVAPNGLTTVYWDKESKDVYLLVSNLPQPAIDKQYQLWAIVDGVPVDAGTLDMNDASSLVKMKNIPRAQAFAITLEKKGGSQTPTMPIYVKGQV